MFWFRYTSLLTQYYGISDGIIWLWPTLLETTKAKEKYRGMFEIQKSGDKTNSGEIGLDIRTHASSKNWSSGIFMMISLVLSRCCHFLHGLNKTTNKIKLVCCNAYYRKALAKLIIYFWEEIERKIQRQIFSVLLVSAYLIKSSFIPCEGFPYQNCPENVANCHKNMQS